MAKSPKRKMVNLALQGGGAHGAFTWGALDRLLEDGRYAIDGICACSAGTMNALALAQGLDSGGNDGARESLENFWQAVSTTAGRYSPISSSTMRQFFPQEWSNSLAFFFMESTSRLLSPYQLNPLDINPLRDLLEAQIDFDRLRRTTTSKLFISTTHVATGKIRVFDSRELTLKVALASACLPNLFKAVEIDEEYYWDGGYMGNPSLYPLFYKTDSRDIIIFHINPMVRSSLPRTAPDIHNRINEISFNSSLIQDMRAIAFVKKLINHDMLKDEYREQFKDILLHSVRADRAMCDLSVASKFTTNWDFLCDLKERGRQTMEQWLTDHADDVGVRDSVDLHKEFLSSVTDLFEQKHN